MFLSFYAKQIDTSINKFPIKIIEAMKDREDKLFDNEVFLAAIYMDPRFNYIGSTLISDEQRNKAKVCFNIC